MPPPKSPEDLTNATATRISTAADIILNRLGIVVGGAENQTLQAKVPIETSEFVTVSKDGLPTVTITKPEAGFAARAVFTHSILYARLGGNDNNTWAMLLKDDPPAGSVEHPGEAIERTLKEPDAVKLANDLERIAEI